MVDRKLPYGDVTDEDVRAWRKIEYLYKQFERVNSEFSPRTSAKCLLCFAYEYYIIGMDEVSDELMQKALEVCPEYFDQYLVEDMGENPDLEKVYRKLAEFYEDQFKGRI